MSKYFNRSAQPEQGAANPQFFSDLAAQAQQIQQQNSGAAQQAQQYAQNLLHTGKINKQQYDRMWGLAQQIARRFGGR